MAALAGPLVTCQPQPPSQLDAIATDYVQLVLALDSHAPGYVESYYGPDGWWSLAAERFVTSASIGFEANRRLQWLDAADLTSEPSAERRAFLTRQLASVTKRVELLRGAKMSFDDETRALYGGTAPKLTESELSSRLETLDDLLPGEGPLVARYRRHRERYVVPSELLEPTFEAAIAECRRRTLEHIALPQEEGYRLSLVRGKPWAAYSWYEGDYRSLIELNLSFAPTIDAMVDLACHELYPGHHTMQVLLESHRVRARGWPEHTVNPISSPLAAASEGTAELAPEVAFSAEERRRFEREVLFPLAGLDAADFDHYDAVRRASKTLRSAHIEIARRYLNRELARRDAFEWMRRYALVPDPEGALRYLTIYRTQIASYAIGEAAARRALDPSLEPSEQWASYEELLMLKAGTLPQ